MKATELLVKINRRLKERGYRPLSKKQFVITLTTMGARAEIDITEKDISLVRSRHDYIIQKMTEGKDDK